MNKETIASERYKQVRNITIIGAIINSLLGVLKVTFGIIGHSHALFADGIHSFSDLITDGLIIFASRYGSHGADADHPYGHGRIETAGTVILALILIFAGAGIILDAGEHVFSPTKQLPSHMVIAVAVLSVLANEALYHFTRIVATRIRSELLRANAWHHRSDAASSIVVIIGVAGTLMGFTYLDAVAAVIVGIMILKMGWEVGWSSIMELIDTGVNEELLAEISHTIEAVPGVESIHQLRTRSMGGKVLVDVHIIVEPTLSVSEGHHIGQRVHYALLDADSDITDVTIHIDPEDDETAKPSLHLPDRDTILQTLRERWRMLPENDDIQEITLHYLDGEVHVDIVLSFHSLSERNNDAEQIKTVLADAATGLDYLSEIRVSFRK